MEEGHASLGKNDKSIFQEAGQMEKKTVKTVKIDTNTLLYALEDRSLERSYFLDWGTGQIEILFPDGNMDDDEELLQERIEAGNGRYRNIDPLEPQESYSIMKDFVSSLDNSKEDMKAAKALLRALSGKKPFRHFKETLTHYPEIREQWFSFKQERFKNLAICELSFEIEELEKSGTKVIFLPLPGENSQGPTG